MDHDPRVGLNPDTTRTRSVVARLSSPLRMRIAWFSPFPPVRSGIASYSAEVIPLLRKRFVIDCYDVRSTRPRLIDQRPVPPTTPRMAAVNDAHDFVWRNRRDPYDLVVYQLG